MNPLTALMPTHAMFASAVCGEHSAPAQPPAEPCPKCKQPGTFIRDRGFADGSGLVYMCENESCEAHNLYYYPAVADPIRKFVILQDQDGAEHPIVFSRHIQHNTVVPRGFKAVSAGFALIRNGRVLILDQFGSESLNLNPRSQDKEIIQKFIS
jgi:hypothetical protein